MTREGGRWRRPLGDDSPGLAGPAGGWRPARSGDAARPSVGPLSANARRAQPVEPATPPLLARPPERYTPEKELKVRVPLSYHIQLHTIKVLHGQSISDTVRIALDAYFQSLGHPEEEAPKGGKHQEPQEREPSGQQPQERDPGPGGEAASPGADEAAGRGGAALRGSGAGRS